jgi:hypothetical protein
MPRARLAEGTAQFRDAPAANRLDQRFQELRWCSFNLRGMREVIGKDVQFPERHHQAAAGQPHRLQTRVLGVQPFLVDVVRIPSKVLEQRAVFLDVGQPEVTEQAMLPGHIPLYHSLRS